DPLYEADPHWERHIARHWDRAGVVEALAELGDRLRLQGPGDQGPYKVSYTLGEADQSILPAVRQALRRRGLLARPHLFQHWYLDVLPLTASKSEAIRYLALRWRACGANAGCSSPHGRRPGVCSRGSTTTASCSEAARVAESSGPAQGEGSWPLPLGWAVLLSGIQ
ncbi:MAG: HAD family hydrolase, partial [Cyanobium sp.]